jgi:hypothetical protein
MTAYNAYNTYRTKNVPESAVVTGGAVGKTVAAVKPLKQLIVIRTRRWCVSVRDAITT